MTKGTFTVGRGALVPAGALIPADAPAEAALAGLKVGTHVLVEIVRPRNVAHHRLAFALLQKIAEAKGEPVDVILTWLKVSLGRVDFVRMPNGKTVACPRSIAFASMSQADFQQFWKEALPLITEHIMPGLPEAEYQEMRDIIAGKNA